MATGLKIALGLFIIAATAGLLGFGVVLSPVLPWARIVFYIAGTLCVPALFLGMLGR
jgi:uncharacterized membrane protein YtjA (UPF0391 family)